MEKRGTGIHIVFIFLAFSSFCGVQKANSATSQQPMIISLDGLWDFVNCLTARLIDFPAKAPRGRGKTKGVCHRAAVLDFNIILGTAT